MHCCTCATEGGKSLKEAVDSACELCYYLLCGTNPGFIPALESASQLGEAKLLVNISGRGDKDLDMFVICTVISLELTKMVSFLGHLRMARGLLNKQEQTGLVGLWCILK